MSSFTCIDCCGEIKCTSKLTLCSSCFNKPFHRSCIKPPSTPDNVMCPDCKNLSPKTIETRNSKDSKPHPLLAMILHNDYLTRAELHSLRKENFDLRSLVTSLSLKLDNVLESRDQVPDLEHQSRKRSRTARDRYVSPSIARSSRDKSASSTPRLSTGNIVEPQPQRSVVKGTLSISSRLRTVKTLHAYPKVFISRFAPDLTPKEISDHLSDHQITPVRVCKIKTRRVGIYSSFCIVCPDEASFTKCLSPDCWPVESIIMQFTGHLNDTLVVSSHPSSSPLMASAVSLSASSSSTPGTPPVGPFQSS